MPVAYQISKAKHTYTVDDLMSGKGAYLYGGRWNTEGSAVVYMSGTQSLAMLEMLVHTSDTDLLNHYVVAKIEFGNDLIQTVEVEDLPKQWNDSLMTTIFQSIGDLWLTDRSSCILRVPSVLVTNEHNYLCNPSHPDFSHITASEITNLKFDARFTR